MASVGRQPQRRVALLVANFRLRAAVYNNQIGASELGAVHTGTHSVVLGGVYTRTSADN